MKLTRKNFLRLASASSAGVALDGLLSACGGGGGGGDSGANAATVNAQGAVTPDAPTVPTNGVTAGAGRWSDPAVWGGALPTAVDRVTVAAGQALILDVANAVCFSLDIQGTLTADTTKDLGLTTGNVNVGAAGVWTIGTEAAPYPASRTCTITLNGAEAGRTARTVSGVRLGFSNDGVGRSIQVQTGGRLNFIGTAPTVARTKLNAHAAVSASGLTLEAGNTGWKSGDEIALGTTDFYGIASAERLVLSANASGATITCTTGISAKRWGTLQYVTDSGMSETPGALSNAPVGTPTVLDERAFVVHLRRNIIVQGASDSAWTTRGFGAHCMFMGRSTDIKLNGVRFRRVGQAGAIGRYPLHWHMMSYQMPGGMNSPSNGSFVGAVTGNYAKNCAVDQSAQRMVVIHGTHGVTLDGNVGFDITGHAIFLEDGSEQDNVIKNNVVLKVRAPTAANKLLNHDAAASDAGFQIGITGFNGSSGLWLANPKNVVTDNWVNDVQGTGIWNAFAERCFGLSSTVALNPNTTALTTWSNNWAYGCKGVGVQTNRPPVDDSGNVSDSTTYGASFIGNPLIGVHAFKNAAGGYSNRVLEAKYQDFICADNAGMDVFGQAQVDSSVGLRFLSVAESLNKTNSRFLSSKRAAFATYHELLNFQDCLLVGYRYIEGVSFDTASTRTGGGIFRLDDLYLQPMFTFGANIGNRLVNCDPPYRTKPPNIDGDPLTIAGTSQFRNWTLAGAIRDIGGLFVPAGSHWIFDHPFFTYGTSGLVNVVSAGNNGKYTTRAIDRYFGIGNFNHTRDSGLDFKVNLPLAVTRQDAAGVAVPGATWNVGDGNLSPFLGWMRHFCAHQGGRYLLQFPGNIANTVVQFDVTMMDSVDDIFLLGVEFSGAVPAKVIQRAKQFASYAGNVPTVPSNADISAGTARRLTASTEAAVLADTTGTLFWQDTANNRVWFKVKVGGLALAEPYVGYSQTTYKPVSVAVTA